jgi:aryl-alcohol dehydrogenase-like predicted oxidoreductase
MTISHPVSIGDMKLSRVGFGAWAIGGSDWSSGWGPQDDDASVAAILHAVEAGVNWIDTASVYGLGHSEEVVGRVLRQLSPDERPYVFTKGGRTWDETNRGIRPKRIGDPATIRQNVEDSLRRLGVERIDLYQMHQTPEDGHTIEDYWPVFRELVDQGKVRAVGLSNHDVSLLERAAAIGPVDAVQPLFNLVHREAASDILPWCLSHGTGVIVYSPMASGLLTGSFTEERARSLGPDDWRSRSPDFSGEQLRRNLAVANALRPIAARHGVSVGAVAIAWTLQFPAVTGAIVGARTPEQVDGWVGAADLAITDEDLDDITEALFRSGAGSGPLRPSA